MVVELLVGIFFLAVIGAPLWFIVLLVAIYLGSDHD